MGGVGGEEMLESYKAAELVDEMAPEDGNSMGLRSRCELDAHGVSVHFAKLERRTGTPPA